MEFGNYLYYSCVITEPWTLDIFVYLNWGTVCFLIYHVEKRYFMPQKLSHNQYV